MSFLSIDNLKVDYVTDDGIVHALNGVSLELVQGETLGLVGETGAGKTTMAKCIMGILPKRTGKIRSGEITFEEKEFVKVLRKRVTKYSRRTDSHDIPGPYDLTQSCSYGW